MKMKWYNINDSKKRKIAYTIQNNGILLRMIAYEPFLDRDIIEYFFLEINDIEKFINEMQTNPAILQLKRQIEKEKRIELENKCQLCGKRSRFVVCRRCQRKIDEEQYDNDIPLNEEK